MKELSKYTAHVLRWGLRISWLLFIGQNRPVLVYCIKVCCILIIHVKICEFRMLIAINTISGTCSTRSKEGWAGRLWGAMTNSLFPHLTLWANYLLRRTGPETFRWLIMSWDGKFSVFSFFFQPSVSLWWINEGRWGDKKLHELRFLIGLTCTMRVQPLARWSVVNAKSLPTTLHLMRLSDSLASASHSACGLYFSVLLYCKVWTHPLSLCSHPIHCPSLRSMTAENKKKTLLSCSLCTFSSIFSPPFKSNRDWSEHNQPIPESGSGTPNPCRFPGSPAKFGAFQCCLFFLSFGEGERM